MNLATAGRNINSYSSFEKQPDIYYNWKYIYYKWKYSLWGSFIEIKPQYKKTSTFIVMLCSNVKTLTSKYSALEGGKEIGILEEERNL